MKDELSQAQSKLETKDRQLDAIIDKQAQLAQSLENKTHLRNENTKRDMQVLKMEKEVAIKQNARLNSQLIEKNKRIESLKRTLKDARASKFTFYLLVITLILILQISSQSV